MEAFRRIVAYFVGKKVDIIKNVPIEISTMIINMLDDQSLRSASKVSRTWRTIVEYERKRRLLRRTNITRNIICQRVKYSVSRILMFKINERNGSIIMDDPNRSRRSLIKCIYLKGKKSKKSEIYSRNNMRF